MRYLILPKTSKKWHHSPWELCLFKCSAISI